MFYFCVTVNTENPSLSSIQGHVSCNGMSVPHKLERTKDTSVWHLKFRPFVPGTYKVQLTHNGLALTSKSNNFAGVLCRTENESQLQGN